MPAVNTVSDEPFYCSQQISIPSELPDILKQFTKAAIRTQPKDVLAWSAAYFRALANGETPPVKERLEMPVATQRTDTGLTPGLLRVLHNQLGPRKTIPVAFAEEKWKDLALPKERFDELVSLGNFTGEFKWLDLFALCCSALGETLTDAMRIVCEILTADPEGGAARIPYNQFKEIYQYLAVVDGEIAPATVQEVLRHLDECKEKQGGMVKPVNFLANDCPPLT